jgi:CubicO group peptidase (beta-lactamase class C family)
VLEKLTGKAVGRVVRERVFAPLGMNSSALLLPVALDARYAPGHNGRGEPIPPYGATVVRQLRTTMTSRNASIDDVTVEDAEQAIRAAEPTLPVLPNFLLPNAAASLVTTAADFGRFLRHMVTARAAGGAPAAIANLMFAPQVRGNEAVSWGLGAGLEAVNGRQCAWQWGDNAGYKNFFFADTTRPAGMVVFCNGDRGARVYERLIRMKDGNDHPAFLFI